jgi:O-antigen/teichoic acid export membrane protein
MEDNPNPKKRIIQVVSIFIALIGGICLVGMLFASEIIHVLLPPSYYGATPYVVPIILGYLMLGFYLFSVQPLFYYEKTTLIPLLTGVSAIINVLLNLWLVPRYGAMAAAWVTTITHSIRFLLTFAVGRGYQKVGYPLSKYGTVLSIIFLSALATTQLNVLSAWSLIAKTLLLVLYVAVASVLLVKPYLHTESRKVLLG